MGIKDKDVKSKTFKDENGLRAASTCYNCECQCDSYAWTNSKGQLVGNCVTEDSTGAKFCYVSGRAKRACRDVQQSSYRQDSFNGQKKFYSYEACVTPTRNRCYQINQRRISQQQWWIPQQQWWISQQQRRIPNKTNK